MNNFEVGDTVKLKSGSNKMTISYVNGSDVEIVYFNKVTGELRYEYIDPQLLIKA